MASSQGPVPALEPSRNVRQKLLSQRLIKPAEMGAKISVFFLPYIEYKSIRFSISIHGAALNLLVLN
jgi:hypothetical protein